MPISMYGASVPLFTQMLNGLSGVLDKGAAFAATKKVDQAVLLGSRLAPDMLTLTRQVQIASDTSKMCVARLAGIEAPKYEDNELTFDELKARIAKTVAFFDTVTAPQVDGSEEREITIKLPSRELKFTGERYLLNWAIPNFTFHCATAFAILRRDGVEIGKQDFLGKVV